MILRHVSRAQLICIGLLLATPWAQTGRAAASDTSARRQSASATILRLSRDSLVTLDAPVSPTDQPAPSAVSSLITHIDLEAIGVHVRRVRYDTPGASISYEVSIDTPSNAGAFVQVECVVLRDEAGMTDLATTDAATDLTAKAARRNSSEKTDSVFLVLGREVPRAYLVFEFSTPGKPNQRFILPVTSVPRRKT